MVDSTKIITVIIAVFLPFLAVFMVKGAGRDLLINIILCCFFWFPGILHALYVVLTSS
ncbi:Amphotericin B resistance protein [Komagataella phaffii CBS 7435]|uniref:Uncharacterized protein n=2 Tax=Komagataella phaffii TaxID=460519 RepID=C4QV57_KOMPG|nr:Hypothetical protein PAS_chr1-3_0075 [Komagataella phaffii GS115]CAH2445782.1 Plasma Membrane Proteolipid [Komagataella phaffii CBS 7435]CAY67129.1 Hypothetical protein PAS_chr1-3_0075 [Komagataella phaffii GS115]SCV11757.1 Amphotericin B resistance protein [Komagataella phaffii CBS 7435]